MRVPRRSIVPSADNKLLACALDNEKVEILKIPFDTGSYKRITKLSTEDGRIQAMAWSANGALAIMRDADQNAIKIYTPTNNGDCELKKIIDVNSFGLRNIVWWITNDTLAVKPYLSAVQALKVMSNGTYENVTNRVVNNLSEAKLDRIASSIDGTLLATNQDSNCKVKIWKANNNGLYELLTTLEGHTNSVIAVAWSVNGTLATGSCDNTVKIWKANGNGNYELAVSIDCNMFPNNITWSEDGTLLAATNICEAIIIPVALYLDTHNYLNKQLSYDEIMLLKHIAQAQEKQTVYQLNTSEHVVYENIGGNNTAVKKAFHTALDRYIAVKQ